jgi:hypothetical protein
MQSRIPLGPPGEARVAMRFRFNPQVLVILGTALVCFYLLREAIPAWIYWLYRDTYRQVDFVMEEAKANEGYPLIRGHLEPGGEESVLEARAAEGGYALAGVPELVRFEPGRRVRVWSSDAAPVVGFGRGRSTGMMPVSALSHIPGLLPALGWTGAALLSIIAVPLLIVRLGLWTRTWRSETRFRPADRPPAG